jgi:site-specific DNA recombinase
LKSFLFKSFFICLNEETPGKECNKILLCIYSCINSSQSEHGVSLKTQEDTIREWIDNPRNNARLVMLESDAGISGTLKMDERPGLKKILQNLKRGNIFLAYSVSRISRNFTESMNIVERVAEKGGHFVSVCEGYDTSTPTGITVMQIMASIAQSQVMQVSEYAKETVVTFKEQKRHYGSIPYGWKKISKDKGSGLCEVPEQQRIIQLIREMRATRNEKGEAMPFSHIAEYLDKIEVPPPRGKKWYYETVKNIHGRTEVFTKGRESNMKTELNDDPNNKN